MLHLRGRASLHPPSVVLCLCASFIAAVSFQPRLKVVGEPFAEFAIADSVLFLAECFKSFLPVSVRSEASICPLGRVYLQEFKVCFFFF